MKESSGGTLNCGPIENNWYVYICDVMSETNNQN